MLNASVGLQRAFARLRPTRIHREQPTVRFHRRAPAAGLDLRIRPTSVSAAVGQRPTVRIKDTRPRRAARGRLAPETALPLLVALIVVGSTFASWLPGVPARGAEREPQGGPIGGTVAGGSAPRIAIGGASGGVPGEIADIHTAAKNLDAYGPVPEPKVARSMPGRYAPIDTAQLHPVEIAAPVQRAFAVQDALRNPSRVQPPRTALRIDPDAIALAAQPDDDAGTSQIQGPFLADGTLLKPMAVDTTVADGRSLLRTWKVRKGDTLPKIAKRFEVSVMTVVWANDLASTTDVKVGRTLRIPPVNGVVLDVREGDTLEAIASTYDIKADAIYKTNKLEDRALVIGQTLVLPGAEGEPIQTEMSLPGRGKGGRVTVQVPARYAGGGFLWPVVGGDNHVSRGYLRGHPALDIAADHGSRVRAAAGGTVIFAGWKSNGGGYQVHIAHGSGLFTTYNHLAGVSVGAGQTVGAGQQVGRVGSSGWATGPHLHFEVWRGGIWNGGRAVNPLAFL